MAKNEEPSVKTVIGPLIIGTIIIVGFTLAVRFIVFKGKV